MAFNDIDYSLETRAVVKSVRKETWRHFVGTIDGTQNTPDKKPQLRFKAHKQGNWGYKFHGVYQEKDPAKIVTAKYAELKITHSRAQSCTVIDPSQGFYPATFKGLGLGEARVGVRFAVADPEMVFVKKIIYGDTGTVTAWHRGFETREEAEAFWRLKINDGILFPDLDNFIEKAKNDSPKLNEVLARLRWHYKPTAQICIFTDNLEARLLAQVRAQDLHRHFLEETRKNHTTPPPKDYVIPISFYAPDNHAKDGKTKQKISYYSIKEQAYDRIKAGFSKKGTQERILSLFLEISQGSSPFENWNQKKIKAHLFDLFGVASTLTHSTAFLFYQKIKPILFSIDENNPLLKDIAFWRKLFQCIPEEHSKAALDELLERFPSLHSFSKSGFLQAEFDNYLQTGMPISNVKKALFSDILDKYCHENINFIEENIDLICKKGNFEIADLCFKQAKMVQFIATYSTRQCAVDYGHKEIQDLIDSQNKPPLASEHFYLTTLLADMEELINKAQQDNASKLQLIFKSYLKDKKEILEKDKYKYWISKTMKYELLEMYPLVRAYSESKVAIQNDMPQKKAIAKSFTQGYSRPFYTSKGDTLSFKKDVVPAISPILAVIALSLVVTAIFTLAFFAAPEIAATVSLLVLAQISAIIFGFMFTYISFLAWMAQDFTFFPQKNLLTKLGLFSKPKPDNNTQLVKAMEEDLQKTEVPKKSQNVVPMSDAAQGQEPASEAEPDINSQRVQLNV